MGRALTLLHLIAFAAFLGAGFAQTQIVKRSRAAGLATAARDELERLAAAIVTKIELPAVFLAIVTGAINIIFLQPDLMKQGWLHAKITCVFLLLVLSHLEMFNARAIVKLRAAGGAGADVAIDRRKGRHAAFGAVGALLMVAVLALVTLVR
jgi:uncharacterized membrane protein